VATSQGVDRFDGSVFRHYIVNDSPSMASQPNAQILIDHKGGIWAVVNSTVSKYNTLTNQFEKNTNWGQSIFKHQQKSST